MRNSRFGQAVAVAAVLALVAVICYLAGASEPSPGPTNVEQEPNDSSYTSTATFWEASVITSTPDLVFSDDGKEVRFFFDANDVFQIECTNCTASEGAKIVVDLMRECYGFDPNQ